MRLVWMVLAKFNRLSSSNQKPIHACTYSVGRYSLCGVNHSICVAMSSGEQYWNIPIANTTCILLGGGTSITQAAMRMLAQAGVLVGFSGSDL
jgi:hypothetical protein